MRDLETIDAELRLLAAVGGRFATMAVSRRAARPTSCSTSGYATARWTADRADSHTRCWRRQVEHNTYSVGIVAFRMPMRERTYVCEPFLRYLPG